jgi:hypothetical protein
VTRHVLILAVLIAAAVPAWQARAQEEDWKFSLTPYLWLPNVNGTLKYSVPPGGSSAPGVETGPNNYLENLQAALMLAGEARSGLWSVFTDVIYLDFADQKSAVKSVNFGGQAIGTSLDANTSTSLRGVAWTLGGGYTLVRTQRAALDLIGGLRYFGVKTSANWQLSGTVTGPQGGSQVFPQTGSISQRADLWDAIVGVRGRVKLGEGNWILPYYLDIGAGSSAWTSQGAAGIGYAFKWGEVVGVYRYLAYDQDDDKLFLDFRFAGPAIGATFRF